MDRRLIAHDLVERGRRRPARRTGPDAWREDKSHRVHPCRHVLVDDLPAVLVGDLTAISSRCPAPCCPPSGPRPCTPPFEQLTGDRKALAGALVHQPKAVEGCLPPTDDVARTVSSTPIRSPTILNGSATTRSSITSNLPRSTSCATISSAVASMFAFHQRARGDRFSVRSRAETLVVWRIGHARADEDLVHRVVEGDRLG